MEPIVIISISAIAISIYSLIVALRTERQLMEALWCEECAKEMEDE